MKSLQLVNTCGLDIMVNLSSFVNELSNPFRFSQVIAASGVQTHVLGEYLHEEGEPQPFDVRVRHILFFLRFDQVVEITPTLVFDNLVRYFLQAYSRETLLHRHVVEFENQGVTHFFGVHMLEVLMYYIFDHGNTRRLC